MSKMLTVTIDDWVYTKIEYLMLKHCKTNKSNFVQELIICSDIFKKSLNNGIVSEKKIVVGAEPKNSSSKGSYSPPTNKGDNLNTPLKATPYKAQPPKPKDYQKKWEKEVD